MLRYAQGASQTDPELDGYPNYHFLTTPTGNADQRKLMLEKGINAAATVVAGGQARRPVIGIRSSPWKAGHETNPWHDEFNLERGHVRYYGDHKSTTGGMPGATVGNRALLEAWVMHQATTVEERRLAPPLLLYCSETVNRGGETVVKGHISFCGVAVIERLEQVTQEDAKTGVKFPNLALDLVVLDLADTGDALDMRWIDDRRDASLQIELTERHAPTAWKTWVREGRGAIPRLRRHVAPSEVGIGVREPSMGSLLERTLQERLNPAGLFDAIERLHVQETAGNSTSYQPLTLLWAIGRLAAAQPRMVGWRDFQAAVAPLLREHGKPESQVSPQHPFWNLRSGTLWEVAEMGAPVADPAQAARLDRVNPVAGLTVQTAMLLEDPSVRGRVVRTLLTRHLPDVNHARLLVDVGLEGYDSAAGASSFDLQATLAEGSAGVTARRAVTTYQLIRDSQVAKDVKKLYDHHCQVCGLRLQTGRGGYSEAAHIRGLGAPHHGPDHVSNLLCLCPNHHVLFDTFTIYIDRDGMVRAAADQSEIGRLRDHPSHEISLEHISYHRQLCGHDA